MPLMRLTRTLAILGVLSFLFTLGGRPASAQPIAPLQVYVLQSADPAANSAAIAALNAAGFSVTAGPRASSFSGAQANLADYDAVLILAQDLEAPLQAGAISALVDYVNDGGGLITGEWMTWSHRGPPATAMTNLLPATSCGRNFAGETVFRQVTPNPIVGANLPAVFTLPLESIAGQSEGCLTPKPDAAVIYGSSNGGGSNGGAGLVAWNPPAARGRVASFSIPLSKTVLESETARILLSNTVKFIAAGKDVTPPTIKEFTFTGMGTLSANRNLTIEVKASDRGGSRLGSVFVVEYLFGGDAAASQPWEGVQRSGWLPYGPGGKRTITWQLTDDPGVHYLQLFVADTAGNVSATPGLDFISYQPAQASIGAGELRLYRVRPPEGQMTAVRMEVVTGNPDLYVFGPGVAFHPESDNPVEQTSFMATGGAYQIEIEGYQAGSYRLFLGPGSLAATSDPPRLDGRPRGSIITLRSVEPTPGDAQLPPAPVDTSDSVGKIIYLPLLIR